MSRLGLKRIVLPFDFRKGSFHKFNEGDVRSMKYGTRRNTEPDSRKHDVIGEACG